MRRLYSFLFSFLIFGYSFSQYCTSVGPSSTIDSNVQSVVLIGESGSINFTGCPGVIGLQDLTSLNTVLNAGASYSAQVKFGTCGGNFPGAGSVWIDFNQNYIFEPSEVIGTWSGNIPSPISVFNFTVPAGATNGVTRMRVTQQENGSLPLNPCATFSWGSVMDFSITISNGIDCSGYIGDDTSDPIIVSSLPYSGSGNTSMCYTNQNLVYSSQDVYYRLNPTPSMQSITVSLCGSSFDTFLSVVDGLGNVIAYNDDAPGCNTTSSLTFSAQGLGQIYIIVEGWGNSNGAYDITINADYLDLDEVEKNLPVLYPNPTQDIIQLKNVNGHIKIYDVTGNLIIENTDYHGDEIDVSKLKIGIYNVEFLHNNQKIINRFTKL